MKKITFSFSFILICTQILIAQQNIAEKLGYDKNAKLLIIHADDLGVAHAENAASFEAMDNGMVNSASVMMPTPWVLEVAEYAQQNIDTHDLGLHLVLTAEWKHYRWGPIASKANVPSLLNEFGYFHDACSSSVNSSEVEEELRAQIELSYTMGINPTHLDSHMGCLFWSNPEVLEVYLKLGQEYNLPCLVDRSISKELIEKYNIKVIMDEIFTIGEEQYADGTEAYYVNAIKNLKPGLSTFLIHTAYNNAELKAMTIDHPHWGNEWRQKDFDFFMSETCSDLLKEENIILVTWREINKVLAE